MNRGGGGGGGGRGVEVGSRAPVAQKMDNAIHWKENFCPFYLLISLDNADLSDADNAIQHLNNPDLPYEQNLKE